MRLGLLLATAALLGCADESDDGAPGHGDGGCPQPQVAPSPLVHVGDYRLEVTHVGGWGGGPRIAIEPDGAFSGRGWEDLWMCEGAVQAEEARAIADAMNRAEVLRSGSNPQPCADHAEYDITVTGVAGTIAGLTHTLRYEVCENDCPAFDDFLAAALAPAMRAAAEGPCEGCPPDRRAGECYGDVGTDLLCQETVAHACRDGGGEVVDCAYAPSLECDADQGWVPAATWSVESATLRRRVLDGYHVVSLELLLSVDNRGASPVDLTDVVSLAHVLDDDGDRIDPLTDGGVGSVNVVSATPNTLASYGVTYSSGTESGSPILDVTDPSIRIPERPWEGSPLLPAVAIDVVDE